jgi:hypothetical protein
MRINPADGIFHNGSKYIKILGNNNKNYKKKYNDNFLFKVRAIIIVWYIEYFLPQLLLKNLQLKI